MRTAAVRQGTLVRTARRDQLVVRSLPEDQPAPQTSSMNGEARIKVVGVGGGGGNALNRMIEAELVVSTARPPHAALSAPRGFARGNGYALRRMHHVHRLNS